MANKQKIWGEFIAKLVNVKALDETFEAIKTSGHPLLKEMGVVKWTVEYNSPPDSIYREGVHGTDEYIVIEDAKADDRNYIEKEYRTPNRGSLVLKLFKSKDMVWSDEEREILNILVDFMYIALGRGRAYTSFEIANMTDMQTGIPNKTALARFVGRHIADKTIHQYTAAYLNIKNFRWVNEKYGAKVGDEYLIKFGKVVMSGLDKDEIFVRLGGDNFLALVKKINVIEHDDALRHITFTINANGDAVEFRPKLRGGVYAINENDTMYEIMHSTTVAYGQSRLPDTDDYVWYQSYMLERERKFKEIKNNFPIALKNNEFVAFYQPKVSLGDYKLCGAEALCRWKKEDGFIPPMEFIPILESDGTITKLDFYMLDRVCQDIVDMKNRGIDPGKISVNFSKHHIHDKMLSSRIISVIDSYKVDHNNIEIELTEMYSYNDYEDVHAFIDDMKKAGIHTSLDDFGSGYSTLNMIAEFDTDVIKMDKSFLDDLDTKTDKHRSMVKNVVNLINEVGMVSLAEGVETRKQCDMLKEWNCAVVQGFLFDKPLPLDEFEKRIGNPQYVLE